jgi:acetyltransferase
VVTTKLAYDAEEAVKAAEAIGYPVAVKLNSETITHKSDIGGVKLNLKDAAQVFGAFNAIHDAVVAKAKAKDFLGVTVQRMLPPTQDGYELILGSSTDAQFGPIVLFGAGGQLTEIFKDSALALPPLNQVLAEQLVSRTRISKALRGTRGRDAVNLQALYKLLIRFSELIVELPEISECDINPVIASPAGVMALDARIVLK